MTLRSAIKALASSLPPVRRLLASRDSALLEVRMLADHVEKLEALLESPPVLKNGTKIDPAEYFRPAFASILDAAKPYSFFCVELNGYRLWIPAETLRTMIHCMHHADTGRIAVHVETDHLAWMMERLEPGSTFLDVGAATGATTLPIATRFGDSVRIVAYEPALETRKLLVATLAENRIGHVDVRGSAVAEAAGEAEFREYLPDPTGETPWLPETSTLVGGKLADRPSRSYSVPIVTLDQDVLEQCTSSLVIKIDVEGYENLVLSGAAELVNRYRPYLSIDIHADPFGDGAASTEDAVRAFLEDRGYECRRQLHVLLCSPR